jgi:hypothetical protein
MRPDPQRAIDCVVIDYPDRGFVVPMAEVAGFHEGAAAADGLVGLWRLGPLLGAEEPTPMRAGCVLAVERAGGGRIGFQTGALVRLGRSLERELFRLPRVLREAGCSSWVRGVAAGGREPEGGELRIWISLLHLARCVEAVDSPNGRTRE